MIAGCDNVDAVKKKFRCGRFGNAEAAGRVLSIGHDDIYFVPTDKIGEEGLYGLPPRLSHYIAYKQDFHEKMRTDCDLLVTGTPSDYFA
jgi:hypothetical protein